MPKQGTSPSDGPTLSRRAMSGGLAAALAAGLAERLMAQDDGMSVEAIFARSRNDLAAKTAAHAATWQMDRAVWSVDLDAGQIEFRTPKGWIVTAPVQVIGTRAADGSWLWAWEHPSVPSACAADARAVRAFGKARKLPALTTRKIVASEDECWDYAALACYLAKANGAYRGKSDDTAVFMTFGTIAIQRDKKAPARQRQ